MSMQTEAPGNYPQFVVNWLQMTILHISKLGVKKGRRNEKCNKSLGGLGSKAHQCMAIQQQKTNVGVSRTLRNKSLNAERTLYSPGSILDTCKVSRYLS